MEYTITISNNIISFSKEDLKKNHLKNTLIDKIFFSDINFKKTTNLDLDYPKDIIDSLILFIKGKFVIPNDDIINLYADLINFITYKSELLNKYYKILKSEMLTDILGRTFETENLINNDFPIDVIDCFDIYQNYIFYLNKNKKYFNEKYPDINYITDFNSFKGLEVILIIRCDYIFNDKLLFEEKIIYYNLLSDLYIMFNDIPFNIVDPGLDYLDKKFSIIIK